MGKLDNYVSKAPDIVGSSTINHAARVKLGLTCSEYCFIDFLHRRDVDATETKSIWISLGFGEKEINQLFRNLIVKGFIIMDIGSGNSDNPKFNFTQKWKEGFANIEQEFNEYFWMENGKVAWTGTKKKAFEYYIKLRKKHSKDFLVNQRDQYFKFLELQKKYRNFDQQRLMCQVFLNPANERYLEDYGDYVNQLKFKYAPSPEIKPKPLTKEDVLNSYGKDNHQ